MSQKDPVVLNFKKNQKISQTWPNIGFLFVPRANIPPKYAQKLNNIYDYEQNP